jgi:hypothetical protein
MFVNRQFKKWATRSAAIGILAMVSTLGLGMMGIGTSVSSAVTPSPVHNWHNNLNKNTTGWCDTAGNAACNGGANNYGTIDIYPSTAHSAAWGGYGETATSGVALTGKKKYARVTGGEDGGYPSPTGCTITGSEDCSGPYTFWGPNNNGNDNTFPAGGYTTTIKVYVDKTWGDSHPNEVVDWDTGLDTSTKAFESDFVIDLCSTTSGWLLSYEQGSGSCGANPGNGLQKLNTSGWYTLSMHFTTNANVIYVAYSVLSDGSTGQNSGTQVWSYTEDTGFATNTSGGVFYGWFPTEDVSGLPVSQSRVAVN